MIKRKIKQLFCRHKPELRIVCGLATPFGTNTGTISTCTCYACTDGYEVTYRCTKCGKTLFNKIFYGIKPVFPKRLSKTPFFKRLFCNHGYEFFVFSVFGKGFCMGICCPKCGFVLFEQQKL